MPAPKCSDQEFIRLFEQMGAHALAAHLGLASTNVFQRRRRLEKSHGELISSPNSGRDGVYPKRHPITVENGQVIIGSDAHYWPDIISPAHRAFVKFCAELKPAVIVLNGDVHDGARTSRHPPLGWNYTPTLRDELRAVEERIGEIQEASPESQRIWTLGNHDARFENRLALGAKEFEGVHGFRLGDHFPDWKLCISAWINGAVVVKHRLKGGTHATFNNTLYAGKTVCTGHLHQLRITPFSDYSGTRFGVDTGTLADPYGGQFEYAEDNPLNHRSGFIVLTFHQGRLLWPEVCAVIGENAVEFRGNVISV